MNKERNISIGVLGGGQLGRMLQQEASRLDLNIHFMDKSKDFPAGLITQNFHIGDFQNYSDVIDFGKDKDIITIEIENVNTEALKELESRGVKVFPQPKVIEIIKDKGLQKQFYKKHLIPTSDFILVNNKDEILSLIRENKLKFPFVQKSRQEGYDGKGVVVIKSEKDLENILQSPSIIEDLVNIKKEIAIIVVRNENGDVTHFPITEMVFNEKGNLLDYLICPANINQNITLKAITLAKDLINTLDMVGILAVELFLTHDDKVIINEVAPRTHNSGHHTINGNSYSQFNLHLRSILNWDLIESIQVRPYAAMINILGASDAEVGKPDYRGLDDVLSIDEVYPHIYGKKIVKPLRKMGHVNINAITRESLIEKIIKIKQLLIVTDGK